MSKYMSKMGVMSNMKPVKATPSAPERTRHGWEKFTDGEWWQFRDAPDDTPKRFNAFENNRIKCAAYSWAGRHGYRAETRVERNGKRLFIRFAKH